MFMSILIDDKIKKQLKEQRLQKIAALYFDFEMSMAAYEAVGNQAKVEETKKNMEELQKSYDAITALP
jgi:hypothetical protein